MSERGDKFEDFCRTIAALRHPTRGCPWDLEQTHTSLRKYMLEEAYEAAHVMTDRREDAHKLADELGDVLLQVVLNAQLGSDAKTFGIADVIEGINSKMLRRHPHVFGDVNATNSEDVRRNWEQIKAGERKDAQKGLFDDVKGFPATTEALKIGQRAAKINFDWQTADEVLAKLESEIVELRTEIARRDSTKIADEMGDVYFSLAQLARHLKLDPETVALQGNQKFLERFKVVEELAQSNGVEIATLSQAELEKLWLRAKAATRRQSS